MKKNIANNNNNKLHNPKSHAPAVYVPCWLSQVSKKLLTSGAKLVYGRLAQWSTSQGETFRSAPQLSIELGLPVRNIERHIKELKNVGLIGTFHPQAGGVNHFNFYDHEWMHAPICKELSFKEDEQPPAKNGGGSNKANPPPKMAAPPAKNGGTPPPKMADINKKEIKINTTTTEDQILAKKSDSAQVVVLTDSLTSTPKPQTPVTRDDVAIFIGIEWDRRLREAYDRRPIVENNILCVEDYLSACKYYTDNKADNIPLPGRIKGLVKITLEGNFHEPPEWVDAIVKSRNAKIGQERLRLNEQNSEARAKQVIQQANVDVNAGRESFLAMKTKIKEETANKPKVINMNPKVYKRTPFPEERNNVSQSN